MNLGYLSFAMVVLALIVCGVGAFGISKYAFRVSPLKGSAVLLFPPYTFYFSFYELKEDGKEMAISLWAAGLFISVILIIAFWTPLNLVMQGRGHELSAASMEEQAEKEFSGKSSGAALPPPVTDLKVDPNQKIAGANDTPPTTNNGATNGTNGTNGAAPTTNGAAPTTNGAAPAAP